MRTIVLPDETAFDVWRLAARRLAAAGEPPEAVLWQVADGEAGLFPTVDPAALPVPPGDVAVIVPRRFVELAEVVILHISPERFALLYRLLWRLRTEPGLLSVATDAEVARAEAMAKAVRRDRHKMTAFVRFREIIADHGRHYVAWFEPEHHIVAATAPFFVERFAGMTWSILTPRASAHWDGTDLTIAAGASRAEAPAEDALEDLWRAYYAAIFNPARLRPAAMRAEMPMKYWRNLPEATLIAPLVRGAEERTAAMVERPPLPDRPNPPRAEAAGPARPPDGPLEEVRAAAAGCRACPLWAPATQTVFGEGPPQARVVFVGEQPGDSEDLVGRPFVGPAGQMFDRALAEAGIDRATVYVTNAVKHFKFVQRGKRRIHQKPGSLEIVACKPWLEKELELVGPALVVALGATAAQSLFGRAMTIGPNRGRVLPLGDGQQAFVTVHPSFLLRLPDEAARHAEYARFVEDLRAVAAALARNEG